MAFGTLYYHAGPSQFNSQSSDLLLEDDTHSTRCHGHSAKYTSKPQLKKTKTAVKVKETHRYLTFFESRSMVAWEYVKDLFINLACTKIRGLDLVNILLSIELCETINM